MIKLIASDLDGTLIPEGTQEIEPGFMEVLEKLLNRGYLFYAASGRQYANMRWIFEKFADRIGFVTENGALAIEKDKLQYVLKTSQSQAYTVAKDMMSFADTEVCLSGVKACYIKPRTEWFKNQIVNVLRNECQIFNDFKEIDDQIVKVSMYLYHFSEDAKKIQNYFTEKYQEYADFVLSGNGWIDMIFKNTGKGPALKQVMELKGLKPEEIMVFGDNQNDISMLELTPNSYVMAHAKPDVKAHAAHVCESVTKVLEELLSF